MSSNALLPNTNEFQLGSLVSTNVRKKVVRFLQYEQNETHRRPGGGREPFNLAVTNHRSGRLVCAY
jgi:hypothetical protein